MKKTLHLISHTHWDREWYMSFEKHRMKLVELMDCLIEKMEQDENFRYFHLDGQTIVIEDYLEIRPQMRDRLYALIKADRIQTGPWYILQDEYLTSGEANIRNMIEGLKFCNENGFEPVDCGYMPDAFGNIAQLPQILNGFNIKTAVFGRGIGLIFADNKADDENKVEDKEIIWYGADGSRVDGLMFNSWYNNAWELPSGDMKEVEEVYGKLISSFEGVAKTPNLLGMNGCDHQPVQCDLPESIEKANKIFGDEVEIKHSNFKDYIKAVKPYADSFPEIRGEIAGQNTKGTGLLIDTASTHIPLKQKNHATQNLFAQVSEPVSVLASLYGDNYRTDMLRYGWKMLMQCHPHDSICCCSCDAVTREMDIRFDKAYDVAEGVLDEAMDYIVAGLDTSDMTDTTIAVFHTSPETTTHIIDKVIYTDEFVMPESIVIKDAYGNVCPAVAEYLGEKFTYTLPKDCFRKVKFRQSYRVRFAVTLKGIGCFMYSIEDGGNAVDSGVKLLENGAENENLSFVICEDGTINVTEKKSGRTYKGINRYEDSGECGESYNYMQTADGVTVYPKSATVSLTENNSVGITYKIESVIDIPAGLNIYKNRTQEVISHTITTFVTLASGSDRLDIKTTINNASENHRLRALFTTDIDAETVFADGQFDVIERNIKPSANWENPSNTQRMQAFFGIEDEVGGLIVASRGHHEYEVLRDGKNTMALTLLRAVGEIGDWGDFPTPDMQLKKEMTFSYSVIPYAANEKAAAFRSGYTFAGDFVAVSQTDCHEGTIASNESAVEVEGDYIAFSTLKKAENSDNAVLRIYNVSENEQKVSIKLNTKLFSAISLTNLAESEDEAVALSNGIAEISIAPKKIATLILKK